MKKIKDIFSAIISIILYFGLTAMWFLGIFHSFKKHSDLAGVLSFVPPIGIYDGFESFWHNDYSDIDWNKQLKTDLESTISILNEAVNKESKRSLYDINLDIQEFSNHILKYPKDKIEYLKN